MKQEIKLILLDLDGTLLNSRKEISAATEAALARSAEKGILIVPCTGRFYGGMPEAVRALPYLKYAITINGAEVYDIHADKSLHSALIDLKRADAVFEFLDTLPVIYDCFQDNWGWMDRRFYEIADRFALDAISANYVRGSRTPVENFRETLQQRGRGIQKTQMFFRDPQLRKQMLAELPQRFPDLAVTTSLPNNIEINSGDAHKGAALLELCRHLGIDPAQTMAFGDGLNDVTMIKTAGIGVAMGNAEDAVKAAADYITDTNDCDGIAKAIHHFCLDV